MEVSLRSLLTGAQRQKPGDENEAWDCPARDREKHPDDARDPQKSAQKAGPDVPLEPLGRSARGFRG